MEYGKIERTLFIDATPDVVFDVVSSPEHLKEWWPQEVVDLEPVSGSRGTLIWHLTDPEPDHIASITVVDAQPPRLFSFRWLHPADDAAAVGNSMLVTFELTPSGEGTSLRMTETGFREMGWEVAVLEKEYNSHIEGWGIHLPRLVEYSERVGSR
ncbi:SRPBCC domain-containing protein [Antrihabitans spumae]|jgi:uncharacterized protein YndB with AHSA1/START domain|uniref:SRPBCC domain-containing protein n=1 Tax=Antrihabitans spumae TaxID=3373370 RepID=A0ABW7K7U8_9NOCA